MAPCPQCGFVAPSVQARCPRCGAYRLAAPYPPPPEPKQRSTTLLVLLVVAFVAVVGSIAGIVISRNVGGRAAGHETTPTGSPSASPSPSGLADTCLVGYWLQTDYETSLDFGGGQSAKVKGDGAMLAVASNGQTEVEFPKGQVRYTGELAGVGATAVTIEGTARGTVRVYPGHRLDMTFRHPDGTTTLYLKGKKVNEHPLSFTEDGERQSYTCQGEKMVITGKTVKQVFQKRGHDTPAPWD